MKQLIFTILALVYFQGAQAQYTFSGKITDKEKNPMIGVQIILSIKDSLCYASTTNTEGIFTINKIKKDEYLLSINYPGFTEIEEKREINGNINADFTLVESMNRELGEVVVSAKKSDLVKRTATGQIFYLSEKARTSGDPYRALKEIPRLLVNESLQSVKMQDGGKMLILIDGKIINSGINPINPKDIESVEVIDVVSARYLKMGVSNILNIKLKKKRNPYMFLQAATRHDIPLRYSMGVGYFEVGNSKFSLYGRGSASMLKDDKGEDEIWQKDVNYFKERTGTWVNNENKLLGELLFKWSLSDKDYLAAHVYGTTNKTTAETQGDGILRKETEQSFKYNSFSNNDTYIWTTSLYYKRDFSKSKVLETTLAYNYNSNKNKGERNEEITDILNKTGFIYDNNRSSASLDISYLWELSDFRSINFGSITNYLNDHINKISENEPIFHHRLLNEYIYTTYSDKLGKLLYMGSLGIENVWLKAGNISNHYLKPRISFSGTYKVNSNNSLRLSYTLTNQSPSVGQLNPFNTSTDPLVITRGNPKLLPEQQHLIKTSYTFNKRGFYITPSASYNIFTDIIEPFGYSENGVFINTYKNSSKFKTLSIGGTISYNFLNDLGNVYLGVNHIVDYYNGMQPKKSFALNGGIWLNYKKWTVGGDISYRNYEYTPISIMKQIVPEYSQIQVNYNFTKNFYVALALPYFIGTLSTETTTQKDSYQSYYLKKMIDMSSHPWILLRYTIRKNTNEKIKLENVVKSKEEGISL